MISGSGASAIGLYVEVSPLGGSVVKSLVWEMSSSVRGLTVSTLMVPT